MYTVLIETANLVEAPPYMGEVGKQQHLGSGTRGVVFFTIYGVKEERKPTSAHREHGQTPAKSSMAIKRSTCVGA
jgi:hypothetical protein